MIPKVSVLVPAWNAESTLPSALESVREQTFSDWECLVVDDGSTDATRDLALGFSARDARFRAVSRPHLGLVEALNFGLTLCRAPYVARFDADDLMHRRRLSAQVEALDGDGTLGLVGCHVRFFPRRPLTQGLARYETWLNGMRTPEDIARNGWVECPLAHPTWMVRRELFSVVYRSADWAEDYDLILRWLGRGHRLGVVPEPLHLWRDSPLRASRTRHEYAEARFVACKAHYLASGFLRDGDTFVLWGYGDTGRRLSRELRRHGKTPSHIVELHPGRLGQRIHGAPVVPPSALATLRPARIVASVAGAGARTEIRAALDAMGFVELQDYVCAA